MTLRKRNSIAAGIIILHEELSLEPAKQFSEIFNSLIVLMFHFYCCNIKQLQTTTIMQFKKEFVFLFLLVL